MSKVQVKSGGRRASLMKRDGGVCVWCSCPITDENYSADHVIPQHDGGTWNQANLVLACRACNHRRGHMDALVWARICVERGQRVQLKVLARAISASGNPACTKDGARRIQQRERRQADRRRADRVLRQVAWEFHVQQLRAAGVLPSKERRRIQKDFHKQLWALPTAEEPTIRWP